MNRHRVRLFATVAIIAFIVLFSATMRANRSFDASAQGGTGNEDRPSSAEQLTEGSDNRRLPVPDQFASNTDIPPSVPEGLNLSSIRIAGSTLRPRESDVDYSVGDGGGCVYAGAGSSETIWNTPIWLPPGARVHSVRLYYYDASAANAIGWFTIYDLYGNIVDEWSVSSVGSSGNGFQDTVVIDHNIDYSVYSYAVNWRPEVIGEAMQLCGFRIFYDPPLFPLGFLPAITK